MTNEKIISELSKVFKDVLGIKEFEICLTMIQVQEWDSLKHIQLLSAIEKTFGIEIQFEDAVEMISVEIIIKKIKKYIASK